MSIQRFIYLTDLHLQAESPVGRNDSFLYAVLRKVEAILTWGQQNGIGLVICGGDLTHTPRRTPPLVGTRLAALIRKYAIPWWVIPGQHDIIGHNAATYREGMLGLLAEAMGDLFRVLPNGWNGRDRTDLEGRSVIALHYRHRGEEQLAEALQGWQRRADIVIAHQMVVDKPKPFGHVFVQDLPDIPLLLLGDYHPGVYKRTETGQAINPGALARLTRTPSDMTRKPTFLVVDLETLAVEWMCPPFKTDVWVDETEALGYTADQFSDLLHHFAAIEADETIAMDVVQVVETVAAQAKVEREVVDLALQTLQMG